MSIKKLVLLVSALTLVVAGQAYSKDKLVNGIDANFPPFAYIDKTGKPSGFDVEAMDWVAKEIGVEVEHRLRIRCRSSSSPLPPSPQTVYHKAVGGGNDEARTRTELIRALRKLLGVALECRLR